MGLRTRILLLVVLASLLLPAAVVSVYLILERHRDIAEAKRNLAVLARDAGFDLEEKIRATTQLLFGLSQSRELDTDDKDACSAYLAEVLKHYPQYTGILTIKPNAELHCDSLRTGRKLILTDRAYFNQASKSTGPAFDLVFGRLTGIAVMQVALGARDRHGELKFVLLASHNLDRFARQIANAQPYPNTAVVIWDRTGTIMAAHPVPQGEKLAGKPYPDSELFGFVRSARIGDTAEAPSVFGALRVWGLGALPEGWGTGLRITLGVPKAELVAAADRNLRQALGFILGAFFLVFVAAWVLAELGIRRPAARIMEVVARIGAGDLAARIGRPYPSGELGGLMRALDRTAEQLQTQQIQIARQTEALRRGNRALGLLIAVNQALLHATTEKQLLAEICRIAVEVGGYRVARVGYAEHDAAKSVRLVAWRGFGEEHNEKVRVTWANEESGRGPTGTAIRTGLVSIVRDVLDNPDYAPWREAARASGYSSAIGLPLVENGEVFGALSLYAAERDAFGDAEVALLKELASDLVYGIVALRLRERQRHSEEAIREYAERLRLLSRRLFEVEESERRRLARELHDRIGQNVTALRLNLNLMRSDLPDGPASKANAHLDDCQVLLDKTAQLIRNVMADLRPPGLDELGLLAALTEHARQMAGRAGFSATVAGTEVRPRLPPATEITLFRIVQEALINVAKHAHATEVTIALESSHDTVVITIADNGRGFDPAVRFSQATPNLGMVNMRERAEAIGARLRVESAPGQGTRVILEAPRVAPTSSDQPHLPGIEPA